MTLGIAKTENYQLQLNEKIVKTIEEFKLFSPPDLEVFPSPSSHFRMRAEFKIWHEEDKTYYVMHEKGEHNKTIKINCFSIGSRLINELMPLLIQHVESNETLRRKLFQVEFLTTTSLDSLITLIYHKHLDSDWLDSAKTLANNLGTKIIGRSRGQKIVTDIDYVSEQFSLDNGEYTYQQIETGFTQPNGFVCQNMLNWACNVSKELGGDLLELYCGNGNFTLPLSKNFSKVLATEVSKVSVNSAKYNISQNKCTNISVVRLSSEEFTQAINKVREFRRLREIDLDEYDFSTVFVDPPRSGLDDKTIKMIQRFDNILYISCNPITLKNNLSILNETHQVERFALFDQFPYTEHRECGMLLKRRI